MKFKALLLTCLTAAFAFAANATIHRVNNNTSIDADFNNLSTAISAASAGDTIYLGGSPTGYGTITLNKELTIIGPGNFLDINDTTQAYQQAANINGTFTFTSGSSGSVVSGLYFTGEVNIDEDNIVIQNCRSYYSGSSYNFHIYSGHSNILFTRNFVHATYTGSSSSYRCFSMDGNNNNILVSNNIFIRGNLSTDPGYGYSLYMPSSSSAVFQNNTVSGYWLAYNSVVSGNLLYRGNFGGSGNTITNNVCNSSQFGSANGNRENYNVAGAIAGTGTYDEDRYWYTSSDTTTITAGNPIDITGQVFEDNSSSGTFNTTFDLPPNIVTAVVDHRWEGSYNYIYWRIDGVQTAYWSGNSSCGQTGTYNTNQNVLAQVQGKSSVTLQMEYSWSSGCYPHTAYWDFTFTLTTDYSITPVNAGAFYGQNAYKLSSLPPIPSIFRANVPSSGVTSEPFIFDFSSKSNK
jgi:hypothetical protein